MIKRALLTAFVVLSTVTPLSAQPTGSWPMFRGNAAHHGRSGAAGPELPSVRWTHPLLESSYSSPSIGPDGTVYVGSADALYAVTPTGTLRWIADMDDFSISSPAVGGSFVYSGSTSGMLYAFSRETGALQWTFLTNDEIWSSPTLGPDGTVFLGSSDNIVYAIDGTSGDELWRYVMTTDIFGSPALSDDGIICAVDQNGAGVLLNSTDGSLQTAFSVSTEVVSSPAFGPGGTVLVAGTNGDLYALDSGNGDVRWQVALGGELVSSPAISTDGTVYIGSSSGSLFAIDGASGSIRWSTPLGEEIYGSPVLDGANRIYVGSVATEPESGVLLAVDAATGSVLWTLATDSPIWSSAAIDAGGVLIVATVGGDDLAGKLMAVESSEVIVGSSEEAVAGSNFHVGVNGSSSFSPTSGTLFYRRGGEREYQSAEVSEISQGEGFVAIVPGAFITSRGLEYYIAMSDGEVTRTYPVSEPNARPLVQRVRVPNTQLPLSLLPRRYHMVSAPIEADSTDPSDALTDDYGPYNTNVWRVFHWTGDGYSEFPDLGADFRPGKAFFLAHRSGEPFTLGGRSVDTSEPAVVTLEPGWNQVGVPFAFEVDWNEVSTVDASQSGDVREIAFYDGLEMIQDVEALNPLQPWTGYFVRNASAEPVRILFPNVEASSTRQDNGAALLRSTAYDRDQGYVLNVSARSFSDNLRDTQNWIGFVPRAAEGEDGFDMREAPPFDRYVQLSVMESDVRFAKSFRPTGTDGSVWDLEVAASATSRQTIEIQLTPSGSPPAGFETSVIDEDRRQTIAVIDGSFRIDVGPGSAPRRLSIIVGTPDFAADHLEDVQPHPTAFFLDASYPNPFSTTTTIRYGIEKAADVRLEIFDQVGRRVVILADRSHAAGRYETVWSGLDSAGRPAANGIYFYRLRADSFTASRQLVLLR